jgi:hypothetical protein
MSLALPASKLAAGKYSITEDSPWLSYRSFPFVFDLEWLKVIRYFPNVTSANTVMCGSWLKSKKTGEYVLYKVRDPKYKLVFEHP